MHILSECQFDYNSTHEQLKQPIRASRTRSTQTMPRNKVSLKVLPKKGEQLLFAITPRSATTPVVSNITLRNKSATTPVVYKVKTNSADRYWVEPKSGLLQTGESTNIRVELRPEFIALLMGNPLTAAKDLCTEMETKDKFLIQSVSMLTRELEEYNEPNNECNENTIFERAEGSAVLNTKRTVQVDRSAVQEELDRVVVEAETKEETQQHEAVPSTEATSTPPTLPTPTPTPAPTLTPAPVPATALSLPTPTATASKSVSPLDLLSAAKSRVQTHDTAVSSKPTERDQAAAAASTAASTAAALLAKTELKMARIIEEKDLKIASLQSQLTQTSLQLKQSVEQHRTARKSLDALRKSAQDTAAREKLMARSSNTASGSSNGSSGGSEGPSSELSNRDPTYWSSMNDKGHPSIVRAYPLSYVPVPVAYFILCWFAMLCLCYFL